MKKKPRPDAVLDIIPCPAALWTDNRAQCLLNAQAAALFCLSPHEMNDAARLWPKRIHSEDHGKYIEFGRRSAEMSSSCDYRLFPKHASSPIWLREFSAILHQDEPAIPWKTVSVFMNTSDLREHSFADSWWIAFEDITDELFHDAQNYIHQLAMELELASMGLATASELAKTGDLISRLENVIKDLRSYVRPNKDAARTCDSVKVLDHVIEKWHGVHHRGITVSWASRPLELRVAVHSGFLTRAMERILDFCEDRLESGEAKIEARSQQSAGRSSVEIKMMLLSKVTVVDDLSSFFEGTNPSDERISRVRHLLGRSQGELLLERKNDGRCDIIVRLQASPH